MEFHYFFIILLQTLLALVSKNWKNWTNEKKNLNNTDHHQPMKYHPVSFPNNEINFNVDEEICFGELELVMGSLGISYDLIGVNERFGVETFSGMFDGEEASLGELEEAFGVFDVNQDGFIDETELNRVVCSLGLMERPHMDDECTRMISAFDENGDGLIDFNEFVKLMDKC